MSANTIPDSYDALLTLTGECINGAGTVGPGIPLVLNTQAVITDYRDGLVSTQTVYKASCANLQPLYDNYHAQWQAAYVWCQKTRDYLKQYLGNSFNQAWVAAGFHNSLAVENNDAFLTALLTSLQSFFGSHQSWEDAAHNITAAQAQDLLANLNAARSGVNTGKLTCSTNKQARDTAFDSMRVCLRSLCDELKARIGIYDSRWLAFGLNVPGAPSTPEVPQNVAVNNTTPGQFQVACDASPNATRYRVYLQRPGLDPQPVFAGSSPVPLVLIMNLPAGQAYNVFMTAVDDTSESVMSAPIAAIVSAQAA